MSWKTYQEATQNNRQTPEEIMDGIIYQIESETEYDVLNHSPYSIDVINRNGFDDEVDTIEIYGKSTDEIIKIIKAL